LQKRNRKCCLPSASPWSSPVLLLEKPNGEFRFYVDYWQLNQKTKQDAYPLPRIDQTLETLKMQLGFQLSVFNQVFGRYL